MVGIRSVGVRSLPAPFKYKCHPQAQSLDPVKVPDHGWVAFTGLLEGLYDTGYVKYTQNTHSGPPGGLGGVAPAFGPGRDLETRDRAPRRAPGAWSLCLCLSLSLSLCDYHK